MRRSFLHEYRYLKFLLFIVPAFGTWFIFALWPNLEIFYLAFYKWNGISKVKTFVGFDNFNNLFLDPSLPKAILNTAFYVLFLFMIQNIIAVLLAVILKRNTGSNNFFRTLFFSPLVLSTVMVAMTWGYMYDPNLGVINNVLGSIGLKSLQVDWLGASGRAILCIVLVHIWHNMGYAITLILAGLQTIPDTLYEAADVEGSNRVNTFFNITLPLLLPTLLRVSLLTIIGGALAFDYVYTLGGSMTVSEFDTLAVYMFRVMNYGVNVGRPSTVGVLIACIIFIVFLMQFVLTKKVEDSYN